MLSNKDEQEFWKAAFLIAIKELMRKDKDYYDGQWAAKSSLVADKALEEYKSKL